jgi:hypothetical protein
MHVINQVHLHVTIDQVLEIRQAGLSANALRKNECGIYCLYFVYERTKRIDSRADMVRAERTQSLSRYNEFHLFHCAAHPQGFSPHLSCHHVDA